MTPTAVSSWQARLFGQFEWLQGETNYPLPTASNARTLLAYLLLHKRRAFPRSVLAGLIAPDLPETQSHHALSQALWHIRRSLPGLLESDVNQVSVSALLDLRVDAVDFEALVEPHLAGRGQPSAVLADLRQAIEFYRGDLLEGYYDDWVLLERERLRELFLQALERLVIAYKAALQYQQALITALRLVSTDPLNESAHREVMRLYHYLGCPAEALRQYETCRELLQREFGLEPEAETSQIAQAIARRSSPSLTPQPSPLSPRPLAPYLPEPQVTQAGGLLGDQTGSTIPLIGRGTELAHLVDWLRQNQAGGGKLILVEGEAGVGKTRLLQEVARDIEWRGAQVLWGKARPLAEQRPLEPLVAALDSGLTPLRVEQFHHLVASLWLQVLEPVLPKVAQNLTEPVPLPILDDRQAKIRQLEGLFQLLAAWAQFNPLVIIIEDIHWADADTVDILAELASRLEKEKVSLILSYRREELAGRPDIQGRFSTIRPETVRGRLSLMGLDEDAVYELIQASLETGETSPTFKEALRRESRGNPLFIREVLRGLYDEGVLRRSEAGKWVTPYDSVMGEVDLPLPPVVEQVIMRRLEQLPPDLRDLLEGLAVLGGEFDFERVACLGLADAPVLVAWLQALCRRSLLDELPQAYRFSHDKIRQVVYENLDPEQRTTWHARLAVALEKTYPEQVEMLAHHYTQAQAWDKAADYHQQSAEKARRANAYAAALEHLNLALTLANPALLPDEEQFRMLESHVEILEVLGKTQLCQPDLDAMALLAGDNPIRLAKIHQKHIEFLIQTSQYAKAESIARQALSLAAERGDHSYQAAALASLGNILDIGGDRQSAAICLERAVHLYQELSDRRGEAEARSILANVLAKSEQRAAARTEFEAVLALFEAIDHQPGCADNLAVLGVLSDFDGDFEASVDYCGRALKICRSIGYRTGEAYASQGMGSALLKLGRIGQSIRVFLDALEICLAIGERRLEVIMRFFLSSLYCNYVGDYQAAIHEAEAGLATAHAIGDPILEGMCLNNLGDAWLSAGNLDEAKAHQERSIAVLQANDCGLRMPDVYLSLAKLDLICAQPQAAMGKLETAENLSQKYGLEVYTGSLLGLRAEILLALGQPEAALEFIHQGISRLSATNGNRYRSYWIHYQVLTRLGRAAEARQALERAYQGLTNMLAGLSPEHQAMSRLRVPEHHLILETWQAIQPRRVVVRLPRASAPLGRPLHADEWVEMDWTVAAMEDEAIRGKVARRRARLLRLLQEAHNRQAAPTSEHLAQALGVSLRTMVMDLAVLEGEHAELLQAVLRRSINR